MQNGLLNILTNALPLFLALFVLLPPWSLKLGELFCLWRHCPEVWEDWISYPVFPKALGIIWEYQLIWCFHLCTKQTPFLSQESYCTQTASKLQLNFIFSDEIYDTNGKYYLLFQIMAKYKVSFAKKRALSELKELDSNLVMWFLCHNAEHV